MLFQIIQIVYWLALSTWFGGVLFIAICAPIIFRTVRENNPVMTDVLSVNLEGQHATLLAGSIVSNLLVRLSMIELACAGVALMVLVPQFFMGDVPVVTVRAVLVLAAGGIVAVDRFVIWPRISRARTTYIEHADEPEVANPAKDRFDREHRRSMTLLMGTMALLLLVIMYSVPPARTVVPLSTSAAAKN